VRIDIGYRLDLLVEDAVVVELKAVDKLTPLHEAQLLSYLKLSGLEVGLLINFHVPRLKDGIKRMVNRLGRESLESTGRDISTPRLSAASAVKLPIARSDHAD
jgi:hypothetical protein